ncbi:hypothetical protein ACWGPP_18315, partial [Agromyces sp. NPDC055657]
MNLHSRPAARSRHVDRTQRIIPVLRASAHPGRVSIANAHAEAVARTAARRAESEQHGGIAGRGDLEGQLAGGAGP